MSDRTLEEIEADLDRATDLETEAAVDLLQSARADLRAGRVRHEGDDESEEGDEIDTDRRESLEHRLDQRIREIENRDAYSGGLGSAMNPEDDEAP
ncbi:hypothetical protein OB955_16890 [Halobacteria archaeon AArc-m2/3/4]|uniref:Uncharacterized protein n=1 Tax=Natronoglomus mannanivorans TaxID=2979990 RepID=A0ABT2QHJ1_9EURY|nr:hypothetical protein [Halobacteria archaeon AArc-m2/3/4]